MPHVLGSNHYTSRPLKFIFKMKLTTLLFVVTLFQLQATETFGQKTKVSLDLENVRLEQVFDKIESLTTFKFIYKDEKVDYQRIVTVKAKNENVTKVLDKLFKGSNIEYKIVGNQIIIKPGKDIGKVTPPIKELPTKEIAKVETPQGMTITGTIVDEANVPLIGANVLEKGTTNGTVSDIDGKFSINVKNENATLVFSYLGHQTLEIAITTQTVLNVVLKTETSNIAEIVVVGYGTQKKATITGAVSSIKAEEIQQTQTANLANNLTGRVSGLVINNRGGEPGGDNIRVLIRGIGTTGDNSPLYVIDGIANRGSFERLNPDDIESISVLKDASAAIYGAQAANGVILVTTKRGKAGKTSFSYNNSFSLSQPTRRPYLMNAPQYLTWIDEQNTRNGRPSEFQDVIEQYKNGTADPNKWANTDWWGAVMDKWTPQSQHSLNIRGGNEKTKFFLSGQYLNQDALYLGDAYGYQQYNTRSNIDTKITKNLQIGFDLSARIGDKVGSSLETDQLIRQVFVQAPFEQPYYENGLVVKTSKGNPINLVNGNNGNKTTQTKKYDSKLSFNLDLPFITEGLYANGYAAFDFYTTTRKDISTPFDQYLYNEQTGEYVNLGDQTGKTALFQQYSEETNKTYHIRLGYNKSIGNHTLGSFIAYEQYIQFGEYIFASRQSLISKDIPFLFSGGDENKENGGSGYQSARRNFFSRVNYNYDDKYLAEVTFRYDGSANFAKGNRYGFFPGASFGWRISKEPFFKSEKISELKLRASWGILGNDRVANFQYLQFYNIANSYIFGETPGLTIGLTPGKTPNPNITWETAQKYNLGIDFRLKNNILDGTIELFYEDRSDILAPRNASVPVFSGITLPDENIGRVSNRGVEVQLNHTKNIKDFTYTLGGQFTFAKSEIKFIDEPSNIPEWQRRTGNPVDYLLVYEADGIYQDEDDIADSAHFPDAKPGDVRFVDKNNDGVINTDDQIILDNSPTPKMVYGFSLGLKYKNFALNTFFQGQAMASTIYRPFDINQQSAFFDERWTSKRATPDAIYPAAYDIGSSSFQNVSTIWIKNNAFLRVKNVELSYFLDNTSTQKIGIENLKVFVSGHNLVFLFDKVGINDPESVSSTGWFYPQQRLFSTGLSLTF
jgi:TonB-dependent starch-binding outer membrane protein SusC